MPNRYDRIEAEKGVLTMLIRMPRRKSVTLKNVLLVIIVALAALIAVMSAVIFTLPPKAFRDNVILRLIYEKHTKAVHWFRK